MSSESSNTKRRRLASVIGLKGITTQALSAVLKKAHEESIGPVSRWQIDSFIKKEFERVRFSLSLPLTEGGAFEWHLCRPDLLIKYFAEECAAFKEALAKAAATAGSRPLGAIIYLDEVVPGNVLRPDNHRKFWAVYFGISELGQAQLTHEQFWLPLAMLRSSIAHSVRGGLSNCVRQLLRATLFGPCSLAEVGMAIDLDGPQLIRLRVAEIIGDEAALKATWASKGASGTRPCLYCGNLVSMQSKLAQEHPQLIDPSCSDARRFQLLNDDDLWKAFDDLETAASSLSHSDFGVFQQASGL